MATLTLVVFQLLLPIALLAWCARAVPRTLASWTLLVTGVAAYAALVAATGFWGRVAPWYTPFVYLFALGAINWHRAAWIRTLRGWPHHNVEWRDAANTFGFALATACFALIAIGARPIAADHGLDVSTLNLYRELASALVGLLMLGVAVRSPRWGRVLLSALFIYAAGTNLRIALTTPRDYLQFADYAVLDVYRSFINGFFAQHTAAVIGTIAVGQVLIVCLLATNGWTRRLGYLGAIVFLLAITPLGVGAGFPATILMALCAAEVLHADRYAVFGRNVTATDEELARELPGDGFIRVPFGIATHAVTIFKPARDVWPWLAQMGAGRGGWYSYDRIDNGGRPSATRIVPELQHLTVGTVFPALPGARGTFEIERLDEGHSLVLAAPGPRGPLSTWAFVLEEPVPGVTRLIVRARIAYRPFALPLAVGLRLISAIHFVMERKQLNSLVVRVEQI